MKRLLAVLLLCCVSFIPGATLAAEGEGKNFQVYANPIGLIVGITDIGADVVVADQVTVGPVYFNVNFNVGGIFSDQTYKSTGYGARVSYQFGSNPAIGKGWVLSAMGMTLPKYEITQKVGALEFRGDTAAAIYDLVFGYRWRWGAFTLKIAGGVRHNTLPKQMVLTNSSGTSTVDIRGSGTGAGGELHLGFAF